MTTVFADTFYFLGLLNRADEAYERFRRFAAIFHGELLTTEYVLVELADGLASPRHRVRTARFIRQLRVTSVVRVVAASEGLLSRALELYESRPDKYWSLTDCTSFVTMHDRELTEVATGDRYFEQAGFKPLLTLGPLKNKF